MRSLALMLSLALPSFVSIACFSDTESDPQSCPDGARACACFSNGTCEAGLRCDDSGSLCIPDTCVAGQAVGANGCPCGTAGCEAGLVCASNGLCGVGTGTETGDATSTTNVTSSTTLTTEPGSTSGPNTTGTTDDSTSTGTETGTDESTAGPLTSVVLYLSNADAAGVSLFTPGGGSPPADIRTLVDTACLMSASDIPGCGAAVAIFLAGPGESIGELDVQRDTPLVSNGGMPVASDFLTLVERGPLASLQALEVGPADARTFTPTYWTGSDRDGNFDSAQSCDGWQNSMAAGSAFGSLDEPAGWLAHEGDVLACDTPTSLLCTCWADAP